MKFIAVKQIEYPVFSFQLACALFCSYVSAPPLFFVLHVLACAGVFFYYREKIDKADKFDFYFFMAMTFCLPIISPLVHRTIVSPARQNEGASIVANELREHIRADWDPRLSAKCAQQNPQSLQKTAVPIIDLLSGEDMDTKRKSIVILHKLKSIKAVGLLRKALADNNVEIKFMAASALLSIENECREKIKKADARLTAAINESRPKIHELRFELASLISKYLQTGLSGETGLKNLSERMFYELRAALAEKRKYTEAEILLAAECCKKGSYNEARMLIEGAFNEKRYEHSDDDSKFAIFILLCEIYYNSGEFLKLRQICETIKKSIKNDDSAKHPEFAGFIKSVEFFAG